MSIFFEHPLGVLLFIVVLVVLAIVVNVILSAIGDD